MNRDRQQARLTVLGTLCVLPGLLYAALAGWHYLLASAHASTEIPGPACDCGAQRIDAIDHAARRLII